MISRLLSIITIFVAVLLGNSGLAFGIESGSERQVAIRVVGCQAELAREAQRILAIELRATLVDADSKVTVTRAAVTCDGDVANISVSDPTAGKSVARAVAFADTPPQARARLLALAVAEMVAATWSEFEHNPLPTAQPAPPPSTPVPKPKPGAVRSGDVGVSSAELAVLFDARRLASRDWLLGGGARGSARFSPLFFVQADALADFGRLSRSSGSVMVTMPSLSLSIGVSRAIGRAVCPALSAGVRAGYVWMSGTPDGTAAAASHHQGPWLGPELQLQVSAWTQHRIHPVFGVTVGAYVVGVRGTIYGDRDVEAVRFWSGFSAGLAIR